MCTGSEWHLKVFGESATLPTISLRSHNVESDRPMSILVLASEPSMPPNVFLHQLHLYPCHHVRRRERKTQVS
jgi:hypothetical protein